MQVTKRFGSLPSEIEMGVTYVLNKQFYNYYALEYVFEELPSGEHFIEVRAFDGISDIVVKNHFFVDKDFKKLYTIDTKRTFLPKSVEELVHLAFSMIVFRNEKFRRSFGGFEEVISILEGVDMAL